MKTASLKSKGGFIFNPSTNRFEWNNELDNGTRLIPLPGDDIWLIFSNNVVKLRHWDGPERIDGLIADLFTTEDTDYLLFLDRDHIFTSTKDYTQIYNPDYYTFTIYKQPNFNGQLPPNVHDAYDLVSQYCQVQSGYLNRLKFSPAYIDDEKIVFKANTQLVRPTRSNTDDGPGAETPPVIDCIPTVFNITQIQGDTSKDGHVIAVASIWYEGKEYPYITVVDQMSYLVANVDGNKVSLASGFNTGINIYDKVYNRYPEFCKAIVLARNRTDNFFIAGAARSNLEQYIVTPRVWDMRPYERSFKYETMVPVDTPSQIRLTKLSPFMQQFIKDNHEYGIFFNGSYNVNNLVDLVNQGNDIIIDACVKVNSNMFDEQPHESLNI